MRRHRKPRKRSRPKQKIRKNLREPIYEPKYQPKSKNEIILSDLGYDPLDYAFICKSIDNLKFKQISTGNILDIRI